MYTCIDKKIIPNTKIERHVIKLPEVLVANFLKALITFVSVNVALVNDQNTDVEMG